MWNTMKFEEFYKNIIGKKILSFHQRGCAFFFTRGRKKESPFKKLLYRWKGKGFYPGIESEIFMNWFILRNMLFPICILPTAYTRRRMFPWRRLYPITALFRKYRWRWLRLLPSLPVNSGTCTGYLFTDDKKEAFGGYYVERQGDFDVLIAEPEKALIDFGPF